VNQGIDRFNTTQVKPHGMDDLSSEGHILADGVRDILDTRSLVPTKMASDFDIEQRSRLFIHISIT
jgi:hypothetical protein